MPFSSGEESTISSNPSTTDYIRGKRPKDAPSCKGKDPVPNRRREACLEAGYSTRDPSSSSDSETEPDLAEAFDPVSFYSKSDLPKSHICVVPFPELPHWPYSEIYGQGLPFTRSCLHEMPFGR